MAGYHEAKLAELVAHVAEAMDRFRSGELDAFDVDQVLFQYSRATKELWQFCNIGDVEFTANQPRGGPPIDLRERWISKRARPPVNQASPSEPR